MERVYLWQKLTHEMQGLWVHELVLKVGGSWRLENTQTVRDALPFGTTRRGVGRSVALLVARNRVALGTVGFEDRTLSSCTVRCQRDLTYVPGLT